MLALLPLLGVWLLAVMTPGPDFLVVVQHATGRSRRHGIAAGTGIACGIVVWASGSMLGLSVLLARLSWMYDIVRFAGAAYLVYLGVRTLWSTWRRREAPDAPPVRTVRPGGGAGRGWRGGVLPDIRKSQAGAVFGRPPRAVLPAPPRPPPPGGGGGG